MDHAATSSPPGDDGYDDEDLPSSHPARRREYGSKHKNNDNDNDNDNTMTKRGGWGEAMELAHQTEESERRRKRKQNSDGDVGAVAVDLGQFRNTEVGRGYQARHVVRQRTAASAAPTTKTRTINGNYEVGTTTTAAAETARVLSKDELLRNDGLRAFRREIEGILNA